MTSKAVTTAQLEQVRKMAREKGIGREEFQLYGLDGGLFAAALDSVKRKAAGVPELVPPKGGRIHVVHVPVQLGREWQEAISAAGQNTPASYNVRKVGDQYPPTGTGVVEAEVILINFGPNGGNWDRDITWATQYGLKRTSPRHAFAIGEHKPGLNQLLSMDPMYVVATEECAFGGRRFACIVWWSRSERRCYLHRVEYYGYSSHWFAFLR